MKKQPLMADKCENIILFSNYTARIVLSNTMTVILNKFMLIITYLKSK